MCGGTLFFILGPAADVCSTASRAAMSGLSRSSDEGIEGLSAIDSAWQSLAQLKRLVAGEDMKKEKATATKSATRPNGKKMSKFFGSTGK